MDLDKWPDYIENYFPQISLKKEEIKLFLETETNL